MNQENVEDRDMQILANHDRRGKWAFGVVALLVIGLSALGIMYWFGGAAATSP